MPSVSFDNFYKGTYANFKEVLPVAVPVRKPDFVSDSGSKYWFTAKSVIRQADHWGKLDTCEWSLNGESSKKFTQAICGLKNFRIPANCVLKLPFMVYRIVK